MLEVVVSMFVLSTFTLTILSTNTLSTKVLRQSEARTVLLNAMNKEMDTILATSQPNRKLVTNQPFTFPSEVTSLFPAGSALSGRYTLEAVPGTKNQMKLTVWANWRNFASNGSGQSSVVAVTRIVTSYRDVTWGYNGIDPIDPGVLFYTPPPPNPTTGGTGGSSGGGTTGGDTGGTSTTGADAGAGGTTGGTTGGTSDTGGGTTGGGGGSTGEVFYGVGYGNKW